MTITHKELAEKIISGKMQGFTTNNDGGIHFLEYIKDLPEFEKLKITFNHKPGKTLIEKI